MSRGLHHLKLIKSFVEKKEMTRQLGLPARAIESTVQASKGFFQAVTGAEHTSNPTLLVNSGTSEKVGESWTVAVF
jgi:hypothetical protein